MQVQPQDDDLVMGLVELALGRSPEEREAYLQSVCADNSELFARVWKYVQWEGRMNGFLLDPLGEPRRTSILWSQARFWMAVSASCAKWLAAAWASCTKR